MQTKTIERTMLTFEELNEDQKKQALDHYRDWNVDGGYDWWDAVYQDAENIAELMGINIDDIYFSGFWSQGDGACFTGSFSHVKGILKNVKDYAPLDKKLHRIAGEIQELFRESFYTATGSIRHVGFYYHERSMSVDVECDKGEADWKAWEDVFADFASWIYHNLEKEHEYLTGDEAVGESLEANEMDFEVDEEGELIF